jgi:cyclopropane-fatty-acyl-phospholipid synthase
LAAKLLSHSADVRAHYDLSDDFFRLFLDPNQTYSCAYFERDDMTLEEAQIAKIDLALGKLGSQPGMTLLDIGCGWGATMRRAIEKYDVNVVGLTLSMNQATHVLRSFDQVDSPRSKQVLLEGWEQFAEPVDRIVSIGAFEHFGHDRYVDFFKMAHSILPADGRMLLRTITALTGPQMVERGMPLTFEMARFAKFIVTEIIPGGRVPSIEKVGEHSSKGGFRLTRRQSLQPHYAKTLDLWAAPLESHKDEAIKVAAEEVYGRYNEIPDRLRQLLPDRQHRHQPIHPEKVMGARVRQISGGTRPKKPGSRVLKYMGCAGPRVGSRAWLPGEVARFGRAYV